MTAFALIFPVELPDKTFIATLVLATRYRTELGAPKPTDREPGDTQLQLHAPLAAYWPNLRLVVVGARSLCAAHWSSWTCLLGHRFWPSEISAPKAKANQMDECAERRRNPKTGRG